MAGELKQELVRLQAQGAAVAPLLRPRPWKRATFWTALADSSRTCSGCPHTNGTRCVSARCPTMERTLFASGRGTQTMGWKVEPLDAEGFLHVVAQGSVATADVAEQVAQGIALIVSRALPGAMIDYSGAVLDMP